MKNIFLSVFYIFVLAGCIQKQADVLPVEQTSATEDCESTKVDDLEKILEQQQQTAFDLSGETKSTGCTLGN